jgi:chaperonin GroEL
MKKMVRFDARARAALLGGVDQVAAAVRVTLGPRGRHVIIGHAPGPPVITDDGATIAREITLRDPSQNLGAQLVREVAIKTQEAAGDGTTTACVLAQFIAREGLRVVAAGANPVRVKLGLERAVDAVVADLKMRARPVRGLEAMERVAAQSANDDAEIGRLVARALDAVGVAGTVTVEEGKATSSELVLVDGFSFDRGYLSPYFVTDAERMEVVLENAFVLIHDQRLSSLADLLPLLEKVALAGKPLLIIAEEVEGEVLATLVVNRLRGTLEVVALKAPDFGDRRRQVLEDIAILTGGEVISEEAGKRLAGVDLSALGRCARVLVTREKTTLSGGGGKLETVHQRAAQLGRQAEAAVNRYDREKLEARVARLLGKVASLRVGGTTAFEMKERKDRVTDALAATRAAMEEGVITGGGVALLRAAVILDQLPAGDGDERAGIAVLRRALEEPARTIAENCGEDGGTVVAEIRRGKGGFGFNAITCVYEDLAAAGVVDPVKVTRTALVNAASIGSLILSTRTLVAEAPPKPDQKD